MAKPAYRAYTVVKRENKDDFWLNIGVAFPHEDKDGFNLLLQALPLDGKIVLRTYKEDEEEQKAIKASRTRSRKCRAPRATTSEPAAHPSALFFLEGSAAQSASCGTLQPSQHDRKEELNPRGPRSEPRLS